MEFTKENMIANNFVNISTNNFVTPEHKFMHANIINIIYTPSPHKNQSTVNEVARVGITFKCWIQIFPNNSPLDLYLLTKSAMTFLKIQ